MLLHIENSKDSTKRPIKTNEFNKVEGYKIDIQKLVAFLYSNKLSGGEIKISLDFILIISYLF